MLDKNALEKLVYEIDERTTQDEFSKKELKEFSNYMKFIEMSAYENDLNSNDIHYIAGIDEVERGPLAGPVVAAAVILPDDFFLPGIDDSKKLSEKKRAAYYETILTSAYSYGIGVCTVEEIDDINIYEASKLAMKRAVSQLSIKPQHLLIDAMEIDCDIPQTKIIKGDSKSISIAAASIIAKQTRDTYMKDIAKTHPQYGFEKNAGYGTKQHLEALNNFGATQFHRKTFAPVRNLLNKTFA